jgi:hypothetical protein
MLTFVTVFFPAVLLVGVLALERMERQLTDPARRDATPAPSTGTLRDPT